MGLPLAVDCAACVVISGIGFGAFVNFNLPSASSPLSIDTQLHSRRKLSDVWVIERRRKKRVAVIRFGLR